VYGFIYDFTFGNEVGVFACADVFRMVNEISVFIFNFPGLLCVDGLVQALIFQHLFRQLHETIILAIGMEDVKAFGDRVDVYPFVVQKFKIRGNLFLFRTH